MSDSNIEVAAPGWFERALAVTPTHGTVSVDGCPIHFLRWGQRGAPGLVFIHGGAAHAQWWRFLAPFFEQTHDVVALDLSGHGDSGRRETYLLEGWAAEVAAVIREAHFAVPPVVIGHSLGGLISITTAAVHGDALAGAIVVDSMPRTKPKQDGEQAPRSKPHKVYPTLDAALARFRLLPSQPCENEFIMRFIARTSLGEVPGGWSWKFDPTIFDAVSLDQMQTSLGSLQCRLAVMRGELSQVLTAEMAQLLTSWLRHPAPMIEIPQAHHHVILDQPLAFVSTVRALLASWR